jgi:DNA-binding transcriptional ArsR family regulator
MSARPRQKRREAEQNRLEAMRNPLRSEIFRILVEGPNSPSKIGKMLELPTGNITYHVKRLVGLGCAELIEERPSNGSIEHIYRAVERHLVETDEWEDLPPEIKEHQVGGYVQAVLDDMVLGLKEGTLGTHKHFHLTQTRILVDKEGRDEALEIQEEARLKILKAQDRSAKRLLESDEQGINMSSIQGCFEIPAG